MDLLTEMSSCWSGSQTASSDTDLLEGILKQRLSGHGDLHVARQSVGLQSKDDERSVRKNRI